MGWLARLAAGWLALGPQVGGQQDAPVGEQTPC